MKAKVIETGEIVEKKEVLLCGKKCRENMKEIYPHINKGGEGY